MEGAIGLVVAELTLHIEKQLMGIFMPDKYYENFPTQRSSAVKNVQRTQYEADTYLIITSM